MTRLEETAQPPGEQSVDTFDQRWTAWQARGRERQIRTQQRIRTAIAVGVLLIGVLALWLVIGV